MPTSLFIDDTSPPEPYTFSLHDALPISPRSHSRVECAAFRRNQRRESGGRRRSEEHTSELQSRGHLVCRLLLEKKRLATPPTIPTSLVIVDDFLLEPDHFRRQTLACDHP